MVLTQTPGLLEVRWVINIMKNLFPGDLSSPTISYCSLYFRHPAWNMQSCRWKQLMQVLPVCGALSRQACPWMLTLVVHAKKLLSLLQLFSYSETNVGKNRVHGNIFLLFRLVGTSFEVALNLKLRLVIKQASHITSTPSWSIKLINLYLTLLLSHKYIYLYFKHIKYRSPWEECPNVHHHESERQSRVWCQALVFSSTWTRTAAWGARICDKIF